MLAAQFQVYANYFKPRDAGPEFPSPKIGSFFDYGTTDGYKFFLAHGPGLQSIAALAQNPLLDENIRHDTFDDYWKQRDISQHLHNIHCPVLNVGGWFDAEDLAGPFRTYHAIAETNPGLPNQLALWDPGGTETGCAHPGGSSARLISARTQAHFSGTMCSSASSNTI